MFQWTTDHCPSPSLSEVIPELYCFWLNYAQISCSTLCKNLESVFFFFFWATGAFLVAPDRSASMIVPTRKPELPVAWKGYAEVHFPASKERLQQNETLLFMFLWGRVNIETKNVVQRENTSMKLKQEVKDNENTSSHSHRWENKQAANISTTTGKF